VVTEYSLPTASSFPTGIAPGSDGALWLVENDAGNIARATACGIGLRLSLANSTLTINFDVGITAAATWRAWLITGSGGSRLFKKSVQPIVPPRAFTDTLTNFSSKGNVEVLPALMSRSWILVEAGQQASKPVCRRPRSENSHGRLPADSGSEPLRKVGAADTRNCACSGGWFCGLLAGGAVVGPLASASSTAVAG
jgi:hypothetical protein